MQLKVWNAYSSIQQFATSLRKRYIESVFFLFFVIVTSYFWAVLAYENWTMIKNKIMHNKEIESATGNDLLTL